LIDGVLADEYLKLEKGTLAAAAKQTYERRLGELRLRIAVSRSKTIQQGSAARGISGGVTGGGSGSLPNGGFSYTQTGLITFDRDPSAPFAVTDSSAHVPNLYAEGVGNVTSDRLIGRDTAGAGESEQLTVGGGIEFTGSGGIQTSALTGDVTKAAGGTATTIANDAVTDAKLRDSAAVSVIGRATNSSGDPADIAAGANDQFLVRRSNALAFVGGIVADGAGAIQQVAFAASQSASSNANTLDDYEEGTWTPVIGGGGGTSGQTYSAQQGSYVKIGQLVVAHFRVILSAKGTITGNVEIQGLPFTALNGVISSFLGDVAWDALGTNWVNINAQVQQNTTVAFVFGANAAGTSSLTALVTADITDTTALRGTAIYRAAN
jgi:hypothetical protein